MVSSVVAQQRTASTMVDVTYSLALPEGALAIVSMQASKDGGATFEYARAQSLQAVGAHGSGVGAGAGLRIVWDAGLQGWPAALHTAAQVSVTASLLGDLAPVSAGTFTQGSPATEPGRNATTEVQRSVTLTQPFQLQSTEVTWKQWNEVRTWALANGYSDLAAGQKGSAGTTANTDLDPVTFVNWFDAIKWLNARSEKEGLAPAYATTDGSVYRTGETLPVWNPRLNGYRLPTEAEWEYAARAGATTALHNGELTYTGSSPVDPALNEIGWFSGNSGGKTRPVAGRMPNASGLYDTSGNVAEWCWDWFANYTAVAATDPTGPATGTVRVKRGGSWGAAASGCRSASRATDNPATRGWGTGFRPARNAEMLAVPAGFFTQGSPDTELGRATTETPRAVTLSQPFTAQRTEVTWKQWNEVRAWALTNGYPDLAIGQKGSAGTTANTDLDPVTFVNWFDAIKWLNARSEKEGLTPAYYAADGSVYRTGETLPVWNSRLNGYRLPTEAEWEYAARAGTATAFYNGAITQTGSTPVDPALDSIGWFAGNSGGKTRPVAGKTPNAWGLYDTSGNVAEWCWDWFTSYTATAVTDPAGSATGTARVKRGGSWGATASGCRSAARATDNPATRGWGTGFRPIRNPDASTAVSESFPVITGIQVPTTLETLWAGYDPAAEPLETEILKQWEQDGVVLRVVRFRVGVFRGQVARLAAVYGFPKGQQNLPGLVQIHGGGQFADFSAPLTNAPRGYATISIAWAGRLNAQPDYYVDPDAVQLFWNNQTSDPAYRLTTDWGAVDGYHAPGRDPLKDFTSVRAGSMTLDGLDSPRNTGWFLATVAARRALTFLAQQPEVNPAKLGVYGHSMGGKLTVLTTATDSRVKASVPSCGGISNRYDSAANPPFLGTINDAANLAAIRAPILFQIPTNDFHGRIDDIPLALQELGSTPRALAFEAHWDHQNSAPFTAVGMLWMDQHLKGTFTLPANPTAQIVLNSTTRVASLNVTLDSSRTIQAVDIYYSQQGLPTTGTLAERQRLSQGRFWRHVAATQSAGVWSAPLPIWDTTRPVIAFANVTYALSQPLTAVGPYYGKYTANSYVLSTPLQVVEAAALAQANIAQETLVAGLIEDFAADWDKEWFTYSPSNWPRTSRKIGDPRWAAPNGAALQLDVRADRANKLVITMDGYAAVVSLVGGMWEQISLTPADFKNATGAALASWTGLKQLRLGDTDRLVSGSTVLNVGATWVGAAPQFQNLRWVGGN